MIQLSVSTAAQNKHYSLSAVNISISVERFYLNGHTLIPILVANGLGKGSKPERVLKSL